MQTESYPPRRLTDLELGWVAGLYEGEGTAVLGTYKYTRKDTGEVILLGARVSISMTDRDVIERLEALWPCTNGVYLRLKTEKPHYKTQYVWRIGRREHVAAFLRAVLPYLGERRREQAVKVLSYVEDPRGGLGSGHRNKTHCPRGHEYTADNTRLKGGSRACRACGREYEREKRAKARSHLLH